MPQASTILHSLKDQIRSVKYSIRAEAHVPGSMLPRALQSREIRRLTSLGSVVSAPAFRFVDGIFTRVETIATGLLGAPARTEVATIGPIESYLTDGFEFTDKLFPLFKRVVDIQRAHDVYVSEHALDAAWSRLARSLQDSARGPSLAGGGADPVQACAVLTEALVRAEPVRQVGFRAGGVETHFTLGPSLYCGSVVGLLIAVASCRPSLMQDVEGAIESVNSVVNARFDRFRLALASDSPVDALAAEYRKLVPFLP